MKKYESPIYSIECVETSDIVLSSIQNKGEDTMGNVTGQRGAYELDFGDII